MPHQTIIRNCPNCGKEFDSWNGIKIYCNERCKRELNRERNKDLNHKRWIEKKTLDNSV